MDPVSMDQKRIQPAAPAKSVAEGIEQAFISEMLKYALPAQNLDMFGGGVGEQQMHSFLVDAYAQKIAGKRDWIKGL